MKLFQQMLVAPAALGLLASGANAAELNINGVSDYAASADQVTSVTQFSDVYPTDWAYQALSNLVEQYGCVAGYPNGTFRGNRAMTRYEAAALLNACLDRVTEVTDELRRLIAEFETELAVLRGRVDGLEARVGELEATQFSTTTKLKGVATFVVGANQFRGSANALKQHSNGGFGATSLNNDLQLNLETSFTGEDQLTSVLRAGNFNGDNNVFGGAGPTTLSTLETAFQEGDHPNQLTLDKLFYSFPIGSHLTVTAGPRVGQEDMLAIWPSFYPSDAILDVLTLNGAPAAYNKNLGAGAGLRWDAPTGFRFSANYVAANGSRSTTSEGGLATKDAGSTGTVQIGYAREELTLAAIYTAIQNGDDLITYASPFTQTSLSATGMTHAFGLGGAWQGLDERWIPSISAGWGINVSDTSQNGDVQTSQSWTAGLEWDNIFMDSTSVGIAVGQPVFATDLKGQNTPNDGQFIWEAWLQMNVTDAITVTPALFYLSRPLGQDTPRGETFEQLGGLAKITFKF
jgi:hypothetical protein